MGTDSRDVVLHSSRVIIRYHIGRNLALPSQQLDSSPLPVFRSRNKALVDIETVPYIAAAAVFDHWSQPPQASHCRIVTRWKYSIMTVNHSIQV